MKSVCLRFRPLSFVWRGNFNYLFKRLEGRMKSLALCQWAITSPLIQIKKWINICSQEKILIKPRVIAAREKKTKHFKAMLDVRCTNCPYPDLPACMAHTVSSLQRRFSHLSWSLGLCMSAICSLSLPRFLSSTRSSFPTHSSYHVALLKFPKSVRPPSPQPSPLKGK